MNGHYRSTFNLRAAFPRWNSRRACAVTALTTASLLASLLSVVTVPAAGSAAPIREQSIASAPLRTATVAVPAGRYSKPSVSRHRTEHEIVADRTATSSTWESGDGSLSVREYASPQYFHQHSTDSWLPVDTTLVANSSKDDGWWSSKANADSVLLGPLGASGGNEQFTSGTTTVGISAIGVSTPMLAPAVSGSSANYHLAWPDANLTDTVTTTGVTEDITLLGPSAPTSFFAGAAAAVLDAGPCMRGNKTACVGAVMGGVGAALGAGSTGLGVLPAAKDVTSGASLASGALGVSGSSIAGTGTMIDTLSSAFCE